MTIFFNHSFSSSRCFAQPERVTSSGSAGGVKEKTSTCIDGENVSNSSEVATEDVWSWPCHEGEGILDYSINSARNRIRQNRIGLLELHRCVPDFSLLPIMFDLRPNLQLTS